ncbi:MAG: DUF1801 domain-containing protein [Paenibacillus sp.]|nr:DUF1801 domain-containing protein [Paenibacillus sp.]
MKYEANNPEEYISQLPQERKEVMERLRQTIKHNLPDGFEETIDYGMIGYVVPHRIYPSGYHVNPTTPLPFMSLASQKNFVALYHMGIYASPEMQTWFQEEYPKHMPTKLDMGKGCIRFKNMKNIPYELIAELCRKMSLEDYVQNYELEVKKIQSKR